MVELSHARICLLPVSTIQPFNALTLLFQFTPCCSLRGGADYEQPMSRIWTLCLALGCGIAAETVLGVVAVVSILCGGIGPCGPTGNVPIPISAIHQPGFWISGYLVGDSSPSYLLLAVAITVTLLSIPAYFVLRFF
jgi:hypothetical protein